MMLVKYHLNFFNIEQCHPACKICFYMEHYPSGIPTNHSQGHLTLEKTVNADAASRMTGISAFAKNINAQ